MSKKIPTKEKKMNELRRSIVEASYQSSEGHIASALSVLDLLYVLYDAILEIDPGKASDPKRDRFILSKGHASLGLYSILADQGFFSKDLLGSFGSIDSILGGHPDRNKVPGIEASTGSLGHGFPMAVGIAFGLKITNNPAKVYVMIGDGECNEGTIWESALLAAHHKLDNLCCIIDHNHSTDRALLVDSLEDKFRSFNWQTMSIDGHDHDKIEQALNTKHPGAPLLIVANTIKGHGIKIMENNPAWHHKSPTKEEYEIIIKEL
jgi:transketolase